MIDVEALSPACLDSKPIQVESWTDAEDSEDRRFYEAFDYEDDDNERTVTLVTGPYTVIAAYGPAGTRYRIDGDVQDDNEFICVHCSALLHTVLATWVDDDERESCTVGSATQYHQIDGGFRLDDLTAYARVEPSQWGAQGPMMNYWYPLDLESEGVSTRIGPYGDTVSLLHAAYLLRHTPLCLVDVDDKIGLALTGGGMDFSWEIVEAFVLLGYLPPVHFELPGMAGRGTDERDRTLIDAVTRALSIQIERLQYRLQRHQERYSPASSQ